MSSFPKFLKNTPIGDDLFFNKSHDKTAEILCNLIVDNKLAGNVIGLEGNWGSGKSNVIDILKNKFTDRKEKFVVVTYDVWSHQGDLTRKTFLEKMILDLSEDKKLNDAFDWVKKVKGLSIKESHKTIDKSPKVRFFILLILASFFSFSMLSVFFDDFLIERDVFPKWSFGLWKPIISIYLIPCVIFLWGVKEFFNDYKELSEEGKDTLNWKEKFGKLLYWFSGNEVESTEKEHLIEEEPSVRRFKELYKEITDNLNADGVVIVFDNIDRLYSDEKLHSIWSSIHTFFAEEGLEKTTVIIPYDKRHLSDFFNDDLGPSTDKIDKAESFIRKTFSTIFRVAPPVLSDWEEFFELQFRNAFDKSVDENEIAIISSLFEIASKVDERAPRDIISFINTLVALRLQHGDIDNKYLALFILREEVILGNPLVAISSKTFLKEEKHIFNNKNELESSIAAIVYNGDKKLINEVLIRSTIRGALIKGDLELLKAIKDNSKFLLYLDRVINTEDLSRYDYSFIPSVLCELQVGKAKEFIYWEKFAQDINQLSVTDLDELFDWLEVTLKNVSYNSGIYLVEKLVSGISNTFRVKSNYTLYANQIFGLINFVEKNNLEYIVSPDKTYFDPHHFLRYLRKFEEDFKVEPTLFKEMNIHCDVEGLIKHLNKQNNEMADVIRRYKMELIFLSEQAGYEGMKFLVE